MANEIEIVVTTRYEPGTGLAAAAQDARAQATSMARDIERIFDRSADNAARSFAGISDKINRQLDGIRNEDVDVKVKVDDSEVRRAEGDIRDLDSIPPPRIDIRADASGMASEIESTLGGIDASSAGAKVVDQLKGALGRLGPLGGVAAGLGAMFGDEIAEGLTRGVTTGARNIEIGLRTGFGPEQSRAIGTAAGRAYGAGFGEQASATLDAAIILEQKLGAIDPSLNLEEATKWARLLEDHLGVDVPQAAELAGRMINQGLAGNTEQAFDIMIDAAQRYGAQTDEVLDATREFGGVFQKLGIDGSAAVRLIGDTYEQGLTSQVERAAEAMEELNTRITDGDSREAIEGLGLSFETVQQRIATGGPQAAAAIRDITDALLAEGNEAEKAAAANAIFGTSFETTAQVDAFVAAIREATTATHDVGGAATEAAGQVQAMQTEWDRASRTVETFAKAVGEEGARQVNNHTDAVAKAVEIGGQFIDGLRDGGEAADQMSGRVRVLEGSFDGFTDTFDQIPSQLEAGAAAIDGVGEAAAATVGPWDQMTAASERARAEVNRWSDNTGTAALIGLFDATTDLENQFAQTNSAAFDLKNGFDLTTEAGIRGQAMVDAYEGELATLIDAYATGNVSAQDLSQSLAVNEARFREAAAAAGFHKDQVDQMTDALFGAAREWVATINVDGNAWAQIDAATLGLNGLNGKTVTSTVRTNRITNNITTYSTSYRGPRAAGGTIEGGFGYQDGTASIAGGGPLVPTAVNEAGAEAARIPSGDIIPLPTGSSVLSAPDTDRLLGTAGGPEIHYNFTIMGSVYPENFEERLRDIIREGSADGLGGVF